MKSKFRSLKKKIFLQVVLTVLVAAAVGSFLLFGVIDGVLQNPFAETFISLCERILRLSPSSAKTAYYALFQRFKPLWLGVGFVLLLLIIFYFALSRVTKYFDKLSEGLDRLTDDTDEEIQLPAELDFMEKRLNAVRETLRKREKDAKEAEQRKNDLVVYLAHDIKTPLTSVVGYLSLLDEAPDMPAAQRAKYLDITLQKAYRLEQLVDEFFDITRFNLQTIVLNRETLDLSFMLRQIADEFFPILSPQGKEARVEAPDDLTVYADPDKLARVFNNILKNAAAYSFSDSVVTIRAEQGEESVAVSFINRGREIPPESLTTIFEKFYRLDSARSSNTGGAGLGLAIAREIVLAHGGDITASSTGGVTVFRVILPRSGA